ncbi:unnamed protein product [Urochloa decumbens]|uniref:At1g61320/AtMIF1 LRR domain-containing protein n=1 Tax=Urochloa decumbens TaxID=240449 RepID=A0ABC9A8E7_9POAL
MENRNCPAMKKRRLEVSKWLQGLNFLSLPEDIVSKITAEITLKEAVRMSAACSNLRRAWIYHPNLDFDISIVPASGIATVHEHSSKHKRNQHSGQHNRMMGIKTFIDTVNLILEEHSGLAVNRLAVKFGLHKAHANAIDRWVSFAIASKAKVVALDFSPYLGPYENNYSFPYYLFHKQNSSHLQVLRLYCVTLDSSHDFCGFSNLTTLALEHVLILQDLQFLLLKCPSLDWLSIRLCPGLHDLHVDEPLEQLKFLRVQGCAINRIKLHAPNLTSFEYRGGSKVHFALNECLKLKTASIKFNVEENLEYVFTEVPNGLPYVEALHVEVTVKTQIHGFTQAPLRFIYLRHLTMKITFANAKRFGKNAVLQIAYLLEAAPFLVDLHLDMLCASFCEGSPKRDVIADHPHHNLKQAHITGFNGNGDQVALVKYILRNAVQLERMAIDPRGKIIGQLMGEYHGRVSAKSELVPKDRKGVLTIL